MQTLLEESMRHDINRIRSEIKEMSSLAVIALENCVKALVENDRQLAYAVILRDQYINEKEQEIDRLCLEFLVRQQPVARPLRLAYGAIRVNLEIERVGDYAESIASNILKLSEGQVDIIKDDLLKMAGMSISMFKDAASSFIEENCEIARKNIQTEEAVDLLRTQLNEKIASLYQNRKITFEVFEPLLTIIRRFERVSDQAKNISMESLYMCTGEYSRHPNTQTFRILFLDKNNSCLSQMAEAISNSLKLPKFIFSSAGIDPQPVVDFAIDFMKSKDMDISRAVSKSITQIPNLDFYQVIVTLSKEARLAFPQAPRKMIMLDWPINDPASVSDADTEQVKTVCEEAFRRIQSRVKELTNAVMGIKTV